MQNERTYVRAEIEVIEFGEDIIRRAKFATCADGHMMGGLDKARRTGVTKPVPKECKDL